MPLQVRQLVTERNSMGLRSRSESDLSKRSSQDRASGQGSGGLELDPEQVRLVQQICALKLHTRL